MRLGHADIVDESVQVINTRLQKRIKMEWTQKYRSKNKQKTMTPVMSRMTITTYLNASSRQSPDNNHIIHQCFIQSPDNNDITSVLHSLIQSPDNNQNTSMLYPDGLHIPQCFIQTVSTVVVSTPSLHGIAHHVRADVA